MALSSNSATASICSSKTKVIVEVKALETILPLHEAQLLSYLKLSRKRVGLLINFNVAHLRQGIRRRICGY